jgi:hypothetical protein
MHSLQALFNRIHGTHPWGWYGGYTIPYMWLDNSGQSLAGQSSNIVPLILSKVSEKPNLQLWGRVCNPVPIGWTVSSPNHSTDQWLWCWWLMITASVISPNVDSTITERWLIRSQSLFHAGMMDLCHPHVCKYLWVCPFSSVAWMGQSRLGQPSSNASINLPCG